MRLDLRRDYLNELGVPQWYARKRLYGAAPSKELVWPDAIDSSVKVENKLNEPIQKQEATVPNSSLPSPSETAVVGLGQALSLVVSGDNSDSIIEVPAESAASREKGVQEDFVAPAADKGSSSAPLIVSAAEGVQIEKRSERVELSLVAYRIGDLLFVDESAVGVVDHSERELLQNIYFACCKEEQLVANVAGFEWPVFSRMDAVASSGVKVDHLLGRWFKSLLVKKVETVVYHGLENHAYAEAMVSGAEDLGVKFVGYDYSLTDMINRPLLKANYWDFLSRHGLLVVD